MPLSITLALCKYLNGGSDYRLRVSVAYPEYMITVCQCWRRICLMTEPNEMVDHLVLIVLTELLKGHAHSLRLSHLLS